MLRAIMAAAAMYLLAGPGQSLAPAVAQTPSGPASPTVAPMITPGPADREVDSDKTRPIFFLQRNFVDNPLLSGELSGLKNQSLIYKAPILPSRAYKLRTDFVAPGAAPYKMASDVVLMGLESQKSVACTADPVKRSAITALLLKSSNIHACVADTDSDGRFDRFFWSAFKSYGQAGMGGIMPADAAKIEPVTYQAVAPQMIASPSFLYVFMSRTAFVTGVNIAWRVGPPDLTPGAWDNVYAGYWMRYFKTAELPITINLLGMRVKLASLIDDRLTVEFLKSEGPVLIPAMMGSALRLDSEVPSAPFEPLPQSTIST